MSDEPAYGKARTGKISLQHAVGPYRQRMQGTMDTMEKAFAEGSIEVFREAFLKQWEWMVELERDLTAL